MKKRLGIRIAALVFALVFAILPVGAAAARLPWAGCSS